MTLHKEIHFENDICAHLAVNGWLYAEGNATEPVAIAAFLDDETTAADPLLADACRVVATR